MKTAKLLAAKILSIINSLPPSSSKDGFEGAILGVTAGVACPIVKAAIAIVTATPSLPANAMAAAAEVAKTCGAIGAVRQNQQTNTAPGFAGGGGVGPNYTP